MLKKVIILVFIYLVFKYLINKLIKPRFPLSEINLTQKFTSSHNGIDIAVPVDTTIFAPVTGNVTHNNTNEGGLQAFIENDKFRYGFAHLNAVNNINYVLRGQQFALTGNTGLSTGPHLHFTVYSLDEQKFIDPIKHFGL